MTFWTGKMESKSSVTGDGIDPKNETFLFTSESVGEGHPGMGALSWLIRWKIFLLHTLLIQNVFIIVLSIKAVSV